MNSSTVLHHQATAFAEQADMAKAKRLPVNFRDFYAQAFVLEKKAALNMPHKGDDPMPRSLLITSAAALAYKAGDYLESEKMIALGRSENPPGDILQDLEEIEMLIRQEIGVAMSNGNLQVKGTLVEAKADESEIKIRDSETQQLHAFIVPSRMFKKIVKEYWQDMVAAVGKASSQGVFTLEKISLAN